MDTNPTPILDKLTEHDRRFQQLEESMTVWKDQIMTVLDAQGVILLRMDQEMAAFTAWCRRAEQRFDRHEARLRKLETTH